MKMKYFSLICFLVFFLSVQLVQARRVSAPASSQSSVAVSAKKELVDLNANRSKLAKIVEDISAWDEDKNSPLWQLYRYIKDGNSVALKDAVIEALAYAENIVAQKSDELSQDQCDQIHDLFNTLACEINNGDLAADTRKCCSNYDSIVKIKKRIYVIDQVKFLDDVEFKDQATFKNNVTIKGTLSAHDATMGIVDVGYDLTVGHNINMVNSTDSAHGNIVKNGVHFMHNYGNQNTFVGENAGNFIMTGTANTAFGVGTLASDTSGTFNVAIGSFALPSNTAGNDNVAIGNVCLFANTTGSNNVAIGGAALQDNTIGSGNIALGLATLLNNTTGNNNIGIGGNALLSNTTGVQNTAIGDSALYMVVEGNGNIALGFLAGSALTAAESNDIYIGNVGVASESNAIRIGTNGTQTAAFIAGIYGTTTVNADALPVLVDSAGQLGTVSSSEQFKHDIQAMGDASEGIYQLNPVTFIYNDDEAETMQYGLIAEEVDQVFPAIVVRDADGKPYAVQYQVLPVLILNELIKQKIEFSRALENMHNRLMALEAR